MCYCPACSKLPDQLIELLDDCNDVHYFCPDCNNIALNAIRSFGKSNAKSSTISSETYERVTESITSAIKRLDEVVLDTKKELHAFAQSFHTTTNENVTMSTSPRGSSLSRDLTSITTGPNTSDTLAYKVIGE